MLALGFPYHSGDRGRGRAPPGVSPDQSPPRLSPLWSYQGSSPPRYWLARWKCQKISSGLPS